MVDKNIQNEIFLELVLCTSGEMEEAAILKKTIPLYLRKLNCFQAGVLKDWGAHYEEMMLVPFVASKSDSWTIVKAYFTENTPFDNALRQPFHYEDFYYYAFRLNGYGLIILGRKKPFPNAFVYELESVVDHFGRTLLMAEEKAYNKIIHNELIQAKEKAEESDRLKTAFLENISHELRTPMNAILGYSKLLLKLNLNEDKRNQFTDKLHDSTWQLLKVVDNSITLAHIETNQLIINKMNFSPSTLLQKLFREYESKKHIIGKSHLELVLEETDFTDMIIHHDYTRIEQIIDILLDNAFKFTDKGGINFGYQSVDQTIRFYVKDTGIGIPLQQQNIIFKSFTQAEKKIRQVFGGLGVGLTIAAGLLKLMDGKIAIHSNGSIGTEIVFTLNL